MDSYQFCPRCGGELKIDRIDERQRQACGREGCGFVFWDNPVPVVAAWVECASGIVLGRNARWPQGVLSVATGFLERDETPEQAVLREVREELGAAGEIQRFIAHYSLLAKNELLIAFAVRVEGPCQAGSDLAEVSIIPHADFAALTAHPAPAGLPVSEVYAPSGGPREFCVLPLAWWCWRDLQRG